MLAATTGAVGGLFGLPGLSVEIPATTTVMLRSIAATAARAGADLDDPATRLQCLAVLSLGAPAANEMESAYFTARLGMALAVRESTQFVTRHTAREVAEAVAHGTAPALVRLLSQIAGRFEIVLSEKLAAQMVPLAGAVTGAVINAAFTDHFNHVAHYHFGILRLEKLHGNSAVQTAYDCAAQEAGPNDVARVVICGGQELRCRWLRPCVYPSDRCHKLHWQSQWHTLALFAASSPTPHRPAMFIGRLLVSKVRSASSPTGLTRN